MQDAVANGIRQFIVQTGESYLIVSALVIVAMVVLFWLHDIAVKLWDAGARFIGWMDNVGKRRG